MMSAVYVCGSYEFSNKANSPLGLCPPIPFGSTPYTYETHLVVHKSLDAVSNSG